MKSSGKTSAPQASVESMLRAGQERRKTTTKLPEGYAMGGVPGGRGGGMHVGRSSHAGLRAMGASSPASMIPGKPGKRGGME